jgi:hypothetical protein
MVYNDRTRNEHMARATRKLPEDPVIRLSVEDLEDLLRRAKVGCYMLKQDSNGQWVRLHPYDPETEW